MNNNNHEYDDEYDLSKAQIIGLVLLVVAMFFIYNKFFKDDSPPLPIQQQRFVDTVHLYMEKADDAKNVIQKEALRKERARALMTKPGSLMVDNWYGEIVEIDTSSTGDAILTVEIADNIQVQTNNAIFFDLNDKSMITKGSDTYNSLMQLEEGQKVIFSGRFYFNKLDYAEEQSATLDGSMYDPEYLFKFSAIAPAPTN